MKAQATVILCVLFTIKTPAQFYNDMSVGLNAGVYIYQGDLTPQRLGSFITAAPGIGLSIKKPVNYFLSARLSMNFTTLKGDESKYDNPEWRQERNFAFRAPVKEFTIQLLWNILGRNFDERGFMPYVFSGGGISFVKINPDFSRMNLTMFGEGSDVANGLTRDIAHGTPRKLLTIPVGIGVEKYLSPRFSLNLETSYRFVFSDYLDGFSKAANPNKKDHYHSTSLGVLYKFGKKDKGIDCPVIKY